jgi:molybdopterin synthase sulfur carrier subunit
MPVTVHIVGHAREMFDRPSYAIDVKPGLVLRDVLVELSAYGKGDFPRAIYDASADHMNEHVAVFVNSKEARALDGLATKLKEGDVITILPPMAGG